MAALTLNCHPVDKTQKLGNNPCIKQFKKFDTEENTISKELKLTDKIYIAQIGH